MAKKYLAFKDDLTKITNADLVIKSSGNSTALADLAIGTSIYIPETLLSETNNVEYIVVEKWNGIVTVMRKELTPSTISNNCYYLINYNYSTTYSNCNAHTWLTGEFLTRFSSGIKDNFTNKAIMVYTNTTINAKVFLPSLYELGINNYGTYGYAQWFSSDAERIAYYNNTAYFYLTRNAGYNTGYGVSSSGAVATGDTGRLRPCIALTQTATIDADNVLQPAGKSYLGTLEDVQDGDYFYKLKDIDGRDANNVTYDPTESGLTATDVQAAIDELAQGGGGFVVSDTAPSDTGVLWIDPTDNTIDETLADGDTSSY